MAQNIFLGFDAKENLYIHNSATFDITSNINSIQESLNTGIDCVGYIDVSMSYFNDVFSFVVFDNFFTKNNTISEIINNGGPDDIHYYVEFIDDISSNESWYNRFIWFNPAYARCPPRSVKNSLDITDDNKIVNNAFPINGNVVPRTIITSSTSPLYDASASNPFEPLREVSVQKNDQVYIALEETITINGTTYFKDCLVLSTLQKGLIPVNYFKPVFDVLTIDHLNYYNLISTAQQQIERILSSDRLIDEYIRYLSYCLTDSPNNVGLISNYKDIQTQISNYCSSSDVSGGVVMTRLKEKLIALDVNTADVSTNPIDRKKNKETKLPSFLDKWYVDNSFNQSLNITRQLLIGAINQGRGINLNGTDIINETRKYYTFIPGDKITFTFTINGPELTPQRKTEYLNPSNTDFQEILIKPRKYRIFANIIN